jgi:hypothetical protein
MANGAQAAGDDEAKFVLTTALSGVLSLGEMLLLDLM